MYSQYRVVKKTGLILRYIVLLCIFSDYYHNPVLNEQIGEEDYVTDKFTYADLKIATTWAKIFWITIQNSNFCVTILVNFITIYPCLLKCWSDWSDYLSGECRPIGCLCLYHWWWTQSYLLLIAICQINLKHTFTTANRTIIVTNITLMIWNTTFVLDLG